MDAAIDYWSDITPKLNDLAGLRGKAKVAAFEDARQRAEVCAQLANRELDEVYRIGDEIDWKVDHMSLITVTGSAINAAGRVPIFRVGDIEIKQQVRVIHLLDQFGRHRKRTTPLLLYFASHTHRGDNMKRIAAGILVLVCLPALATTWTTTKVVDPISGTECEVRTPMSSGSYIYDWASKYDGVFWPHTEFAWLWYCPSSGYVSFGDDFDDITGAEKARVSAFLAQVRPALGADVDFTTRLWLADRIYALRDKDNAWRAWYERVRAQLLDLLANKARRDAIPLLELSLENRAVDPQAIIDRLVLARYRTCFDHAGGGYEDLARARKMIDEGRGTFGEGPLKYLEGLFTDIAKQMDGCTGA